MKKLLSIFLSVISLVAVCTFYACNEEKPSGVVPCVHKESDKLYYEESDYVVTISYQCAKCEKSSGVVIETIECDEVLDQTTVQDISRVQNELLDGMIICIKKGEYNTVALGDMYKSMHIVCETGTVIKTAQIRGDSYGVTIENASFISEPNPVSQPSRVHFLDGAGSKCWINTTIKNCYFEGNAYIDSAWKPGYVDSLTVDGCTFINTTDDYWADGDDKSDPENFLKGSAKSSIFIDEFCGTTIIRNSVFDTPEYAAIYMGRRAGEGDILVENCYFKDSRRFQPPIVIRVGIGGEAHELEVAERAKLTVKDCTFDDEKHGINFDKLDGGVQTEFIVGINTWRNIPALGVIPNATQYNIDEQIQLITDK